jgi:hypothetical protein
VTAPRNMVASVLARLRNVAEASGISCSSGPADANEVSPIAEWSRVRHKVRLIDPRLSIGWST